MTSHLYREPVPSMLLAEEREIKRMLKHSYPDGTVPRGVILVGWSPEKQIKALCELMVDSEEDAPVLMGPHKHQLDFLQSHTPFMTARDMEVMSAMLLLGDYAGRGLEKQVMEGYKNTPGSVEAFVRYAYRTPRLVTYEECERLEQSGESTHETDSDENHPKFRAFKQFDVKYAQFMYSGVVMEAWKMLKHPDLKKRIYAHADFPGFRERMQDLASRGKDDMRVHEFFRSCALVCESVVELIEHELNGAPLTTPGNLNDHDSDAYWEAEGKHKVQQGPSVCYNCQTSEKALSRCGRCKLVAYCSRECQAAHLKAHKAVCK